MFMSTFLLSVASERSTCFISPSSERDKFLIQPSNDLLEDMVNLCRTVAIETTQVKNAKLSMYMY